jgi:hypothetical protein
MAGRSSGSLIQKTRSSEWKGLTDKTTRGQSAAGRRTAAFAAGGRCLERQDVHDRPAHHGAGSARARIASRYPALSLECSARDRRAHRSRSRTGRPVPPPRHSCPAGGRSARRAESTAWRRWAMYRAKSAPSGRFPLFEAVEELSRLPPRQRKRFFLGEYSDEIEGGPLDIRVAGSPLALVAAVSSSVPQCLRKVGFERRARAQCSLRECRRRPSSRLAAAARQ